ncbi:MAG TPA: N-acyl homoserine lactonase family protein [Ktedonobacterales bacterium]|nr:N-acyl homoserine lactonase family protein [Ktedonobacterales bacterium]
MRIHAIQTGTVAITRNWRRGVGRGPLRRLNTLVDRRFTEPLPIYAWVIEHPEGVIVVDTGETARATQPGYFPGWQPYFRFAVKEWVRPEEEIGPQLRALGIDPQRDVRWLVMTHLHTDHAGGLAHFRGVDTLVSRAEYAGATGFRARIEGYPNNRWPEEFAPRLLDFERRPYGSFAQSLPLTAADDVTLVPTPGHTLGHLSVVVEDGDHAVFLAGDTSYTQGLLLEQAPDGVGPDVTLERDTHQRILRLTQMTPLVYLPAHDPDSAQRLAERRVLSADAVASSLVA